MKLKVIILLLAFSVGAYAAGDSDSTYLSDYISSFQARVISYTPNLWRLDSDSSGIIQAINDAMKDVAKFPRATQSKDTIVMDSSYWYDLPSDFQSMARVSYVDPSGPGELGLDSIIFSDIGKNTTVKDSHPRFYTLWNRRIYFDRNNYNNDTTFVYYNAYAKTLNASDTLSNVSRYFFNIIVDQAILYFYAGRVGPAVPTLMAEAEKRLAAEYAKLGIKEESITPGVQ
jgi:hypothetical protein